MKRLTVEAVAPGTLIVHDVGGKVKVYEHDGTDEYYHQEEAANYLCEAKHCLVEIKDTSGKIYRYDLAEMCRLGWL
jgi:hypothetical protein